MAWNFSAGIFVRAEDGPFQTTVCASVAGIRPVTFYELHDCVVRRIGRVVDGRRYLVNETMPVLSITEMPDDVFVFINGPLETLNHFFLDELVIQAMREDCGLVSGRPSTAEANRQISDASTTDAISDRFFAVRRELLVRTGGLACVSGSRMSQLVASLTESALALGQQLRVTPRAIATFIESAAVGV